MQEIIKIVDISKKDILNLFPPKKHDSRMTVGVAAENIDCTTEQMYNDDQRYLFACLHFLVPFHLLAIEGFRGDGWECIVSALNLFCTKCTGVHLTE